MGAGTQQGAREDWPSAWLASLHALIKGAGGDSLFSLRHPEALGPVLRLLGPMHVPLSPSPALPVLQVRRGGRDGREYKQHT